MAPLVLLVGRNNTGKSYIASLIWALLNGTVLNANPRRSARSRRNPPWLRELLTQAHVSPNETKKYALTRGDLNALGEHLTAAMSSVENGFYARLFSVPEMPPPQVKIDFTYTSPVFEITVGKTNQSYTTVLAKWNGRECGFVHVPREIEDFVGLVGAYLYDQAAAAALSQQPMGSDVIYIPAARTGLMLAFGSLISGLLGTLGVQRTKVDTLNLPLPTISFLQILARRGLPRQRWLTAIANDLESTILGGSVVASRAQVPDFSYQPSDIKESLPLHITSSMVTELAPFLLLLKSGHGGSGIVFEEPEAHLHISAQRMIARAIVKLVNNGVPVVVTTHSDTFVQQINNLIHLSGHSRRKELLEELGYDITETIERDMVRAYEFVNVEGRTVVTELAQGAAGFVVPSLNETLIELAEETLELETGE